jgi:transcriptional regulator with XRE-family HTH domain
MNQRFQAVDSRIISLLLFQAGISRRSLARELGIHHLVVVRTVANIAGVAPKKRALVIQALSDRLGMPIEELVALSREVNIELSEVQKGQAEAPPVCRALGEK